LLAIIGNLPLLGWAKPVPVNVRNLRRGRRDYVLVAAAGPASNLILAVLASIGLGLITISPMRLGEPNVSAPLASLLSTAILTNVLLAVFNMIPIPPLDGGNVLGGLLPRQIGAKYDALIRPYGFILLYALILTRGFEYVVIPPARFILSWLQ
jgi:Zn-dependent protease